MTMSVDQTTPTSVAPVDHEGWDDLVGDRPGALFASGPWLKVLADTYDLTTRASIAGNAAHVWVDLDDARGSRTITLPFCDVTPTLSDQQTWPVVAPDPSASGLQLRTFGDHPAIADDTWRSEHSAVFHMLDVTVDAEERLADYQGATRRSIARSRREGVELAAETSMDALVKWLDLHRAVRKHRHQLLAQPLRMFEAIHAHYFEAGNGMVVAARVDGKMTGGSVVLRSGHTYSYKFSASAPDHRNWGVNQAVLHEVLREAHRRGARLVDLGRTETEHEGLMRFKDGFRPDHALDVWTHHRLAADQDRLTNPKVDEVLGAVTRLLVDPSVPDATTASAGEELYRLFA